MADAASTCRRRASARATVSADENRAVLCPGDPHHPAARNHQCRSLRGLRGRPLLLVREGRDARRTEVHENRRALVARPCFARSVVPTRPSTSRLSPTARWRLTPDPESRINDVEPVSGRPDDHLAARSHRSRCLGRRGALFVVPASAPDVASRGATMPPRPPTPQAVEPGSSAPAGRPARRDSTPDAPRDDRARAADCRSTCRRTCGSPTGRQP